MQRANLIESTRTPIPLTREQAQALAALGQRLASNSTWWAEKDDEEAPSRSVIEVSQDPNGIWFVLVREAIGVISVDGLQLSISPKIPSNHFLYLASEAGVVPRIDAQPTQFDASQTLWEVIAHWFIHATETVLRGELAKGYCEVTDELELSRGRILPVSTAMAFYQGRPIVTCEFEEFSENIPLNRLLKAALDLVSSSSLLDRALRHRAKVALARMSEVGSILPSDFRADVDRLTYRYRDAIAFSKLVLRAAGTRITHGSTQGWCFLIRTPELIERGIRAVLKRHLGARWNIEKRGRSIPGTGLTINPDLVFDKGKAVGDVKYKVLSQDWARSDLYQSVAFAAGYGATRALVIGFQHSQNVPLPPSGLFRGITVTALGWGADELVNPYSAGLQLAKAVAASLS